MNTWIFGMTVWVKKYKKYVLASLGIAAAIAGAITDWNLFNYACWALVFAVAMCD